MSKYILVTGGTKGIGKAVAQEMATAGYNLVLTYGSDQDAALRAEYELKENSNAQVKLIQADITSVDSIELINSFLQENSIKLHAVVFNAGVTSRVPFEDIQLADWEQVFFANVHFPVFLVQKILPLIEKEGSIVFTGSLMGEYPHSVSLAYGVTKSAVHALVKNLVKFMEPYQIRVNAVAPGFVDTEWQKNKPAQIRKNIENKIALHKFCNPEELAKVYKMVIENDYLNGEIITVSGGYSYQ